MPAKVQFIDAHGDSCKKFNLKDANELQQLIINENQNVEFLENFMPESLNCFMADNCVLASELDFTKCSELAVLSIGKAKVHFPAVVESLDYFKIGADEKRGPEAKVAALTCSGKLVENFDQVAK